MMDWDTNTKKQFDQLIANIPPFLRAIAIEKVSKTAEHFAEAENRPQITEKDLVNAFFKATPFGFHGPMKSDMEKIGIDYTQYGHER